MSSQNPKVGIWSIGAYLPPEVRTNEWWDKSTSASWNRRQAWDGHKIDRALKKTPSTGAKLTLKEMIALAEDPFHGANERRIITEGMTATDIEENAALEAIDKAGIDKSEIDLLLTYCAIPDLNSINPACVLHNRLGLNNSCFTMGTEATCNSFQYQLAIAEKLIAAGAAKVALLVQSSAISRVLPANQSHSVHFGDGATAVVVGAVPENLGIVHQIHCTDSSQYRSLTVTVPGKSWWEDGFNQLMPWEQSVTRRMFLSVADEGKDALDKVLQAAGYAPADVDFFACHQATVWFRKVIQTHAGLDHARTLDTYPWTGTLGAANLPLVMYTAAKDGLLQKEDLVAMYQGGVGTTYSASLLRWGR